MAERDFKVIIPGRSEPVVVRGLESDTDDVLIAKAQQAIQNEQMAKPNAEERFLSSGIGRLLKGMKDPIDAGAQLLPRGLAAVTSGFGMLPNGISQWLDQQASQVDQGISDSERQYQTARFKAGQEGFDGLRFTGNVASPVNIGLGRLMPITATSTAGRALQGAKVGAAAAALSTPVTDVEDGQSFALLKGGQAAAGAVGGGVTTPIVGKVMDVAAPRAIATAQRLFSDPAKLAAKTDDATNQAVLRVVEELQMDPADIPPGIMSQLRQQVGDSLKVGQRIDGAAALRKMDFEAQGIPALTGQITRDPVQFSEGVNLRGTPAGQPIQQVLNAQTKGMTDALTRYRGGQAQEAYPAGMQFVGALDKFDTKLRGEVTRAYQNARASSGKDWEIPLQGLAQDAQNVIDDFGVGGETNALPSAVANRLRQFGILNDGPATQRKVFNYEEADKLLKLINDHSSGAPNGALSRLHASVKQAITEGGGEGDPFSPARKMAADRFKLLEAVPALERVATATTPQAKERLADDFVQKHIVGARVADLKKLKDVLPDDAVEEARKQIAAVLQRAALGEQAGAGGKGIAPAKFAQELRKIGTDRLKVFFSAKEIEELNRLSRLAGYTGTDPAWSTVQRGGNPGGTLFTSLARLPGMAGRVSMAAPIIGDFRQASAADDALRAAIPMSADLTAQQQAQIARLLGLPGAAVGIGLAPRP